MLSYKSCDPGYYNLRNESTGIYDCVECACLYCLDGAIVSTRVIWSWMVNQDIIESSAPCFVSHEWIDWLVPQCRYREMPSMHAILISSIRTTDQAIWMTVHESPEWRVRHFDQLGYRKRHFTVIQSVSTEKSKHRVSSNTYSITYQNQGWLVVILSSCFTGTLPRAGSFAREILSHVIAMIWCVMGRKVPESVESRRRQCLIIQIAVNDIGNVRGMNPERRDSKRRLCTTTHHS